MAETFELIITGDGEARDAEGCPLDHEGNRVEQPEAQDAEASQTSDS